jgi:hypothetical protein
LESTSLRQRASAMTRRKIEITRSNLKPKWPHHVALPPKGAGPENREVIFCAAGVPSAMARGWGPRNHLVRQALKL